MSNCDFLSKMFSNVSFKNRGKFLNTVGSYLRKIFFKASTSFGHIAIGGMPPTRDLEAPIRVLIEVASFQRFSEMSGF